MHSAIESQIRNRIAEFVNELDQLVRKSTLESLQGILTDGSRPARRGRPAKLERGPGRPRGRRPADLGDATAKILAHVQANDGQGIGAIADATGIDLKSAKKATIQLLASGSLKKRGQRRGTVYHTGSGRPARATKSGRKAKRTAKPKRKAAARRKPIAERPKKAIITPKPRRSAPAKTKPATTIVAVSTDVPEALAVAQ